MRAPTWISATDSVAELGCGARLRSPTAGLLTGLALLVCGPLRAGNPAIDGVATSIAAFLGTARDGSIGDPALLTSFSEYTRTFGDPDPTLTSPWLAPSVAAFFANGGRRCWVVRIVDDASDVAYADGLAALSAIDEISLVCAPGAASHAVQAALIAHCEATGDRLALLDSAAGVGVSEVLTQRGGLSSFRGYAALYHPWVRVGAGPSDLVPPCGFVAGALARSDVERGVWSAPAAGLAGALGLAQDLSFDEVDTLNQAGIGMLRSIVGQGIRIWGVRTIAGDPEYRLIPVRRLLLFIEESLVEGTNWVVFEPNAEPLWIRLRSNTENFLTRLWRDGGLQGGRLQEAFFVRVDNGTMTQADLDAGRTVLLVGVAALRPAEFTLLRIVHERERPPLPFRRGDPNGDGGLDLRDAVGTLDWLFLGGLRPGCLDAADANADGAIDIADTAFLLAMLFLGGPGPVAPFPACGVGPELLGCESLAEGCG